MVRFENKVTLNKITHFVQETPLIIFFYCQNQKTFRKKLNVLFASTSDQHQEESSPHILGSGKQRQASNNTQSRKLSFFNKQKDFTIKTLKNNYLKKVLLESPAFFRNTCVPCFHKAPFEEKKHENFFISTRDDTMRQHQNQNEQYKNKTSLKQESLFQVKNSSLFKGNRLVVAFKKVSFLSYLKPFIEDNENIYVLGGIYENTIIDHNQIKRLIENSNNNQVYSSLSRQLKEKALSLLYAANAHHRIVSILQHIYLKKKATLQDPLWGKKHQ